MSSIDEFSFDHPANVSSKRRLVLLDESHPNVSFVKQLFISGWEHPNKPSPAIHAVYKILYPDDMIQSYLEYRTRVDKLIVSTDGSGPPGNESFLFHGTTRSCRLVENAKNLRLCKIETCSLCKIVHHSFDVNRSGSNFAFRRFGSGIYTSACSSKSDDYTTNNSWRSSLRILILNRVVVGNTLKLRTNTQNLTEPPLGYHSITGEPGVHLNYEETVIYDNDAIRPAFLIVYGEELATMDLLKTIFRTPLAA